MARPGKEHAGMAGGDKPPSSRAGDPPGLVMVAEIGAPHGVRGLVRLKTFTEAPEALRDYPLADRNGRVFKLRHLQPGPKGTVAGFMGINDRTGAETLKNIKLFTPRDALPPLEDEDDFYITDLIGLTVADADGATVGSIRSVQNFGAGDLLDILTPDGKSDFLPFTKAFVPEVSISQGFVRIAPPLGFLAPAGPRPPDEVEDG